MDVALRDRWLAYTDRRMTGAGLRAGAARAGVVEFLAREGQCLLSAQEIIDGVRARGSGSAASVYRVLDELSDLGLLHRVDGGRDGVTRFEIADLEGHHHHVVDESTGEVSAFSDPRLEDAIAAVGERLGLRLTSHDVILRGVPRTTPQGGAD